MRVALLLCAVALSSVEVCLGDSWALLVAGSNGWENYRHQSDVCHAYQILKDRGFPESNIIVMMYDDIAKNPENPLPGKIINQPNGPDVYKGVKIDYKGNDVNSENFLKVMSGDAEAMKNIGTGRVLKSGPDDMVFVNFVDHGGVGILAFPNDLLYADDLENTLRQMANKKQFNKLLFYVEACEAGSMFDNILEENNKILVSTASARDESSFGWYCQEPNIDTCLGDLYSITWLQHMDSLSGKKPTSNSETVFHQFDVVRTLVNESHVNLYGDFKLGFDPINTFFGDDNASEKKTMLDRRQFVKYHDKTDGVPSREVALHTLTRKIERAEGLKRKELMERLKQSSKDREIGDRTIHKILKTIAGKNGRLMETIIKSRFQLNKNNFGCYKKILQEFNKTCFNIPKNPYLLKHLYKFANLCSLTWVTESEVIDAMETSCMKQYTQITNMM